MRSARLPCKPVDSTGHLPSQYSNYVWNLKPIFSLLQNRADMILKILFQFVFHGQICPLPSSVSAFSLLLLSCSSLGKLTTMQTETRYLHAQRQ
jgi:hypothetical protein